MMVERYGNARNYPQLERLRRGPRRRRQSGTAAFSARTRNRTRRHL